MKLNKEQIAIMEHTNNRTVNGLYCGDSPDMQTLVKAGLMRSVGRVVFVPDPYFRLTNKGQARLKRRMKNADTN